MSLKDLEKYQESGANNPKYFDSPDQQVSMKKQLEDKEKAKKRRKEHAEGLKEEKPKLIWLNCEQRFVPLDAIDAEMEERERDLGEYLNNNDYK